MHGSPISEFVQPCVQWLPVPDPCVLVTLPGGLELAADPGRSSAEFTLSGWSGWDEGPEPTGGAVPWGDADGGIEGDVVFQGRNLAFSGLISGRSPAHYWELRQELGAVLTRARWGDLRVDEEHLGLARQVRVARGGRPVFGDPMSDRVGQYQVQFQSASHLRLGVDAQSATLTAAGVTAKNLGNLDATVTVTVDGPVTNPGVSWPGGSWLFDGWVAAGQRLVIDMDQRTVVDPATGNRFRQHARGDWLSLPPGDTLLKRTGTGNGTVRAKWRSTWS